MDTHTQRIPRASKLEQIFLCPGSFRAEQGIESLEAGDAAESGRKVHAVCTDLLRVWLPTMECEVPEAAFEDECEHAELDGRETSVARWITNTVCKDTKERGGATQVRVERNHKLLLEMDDGIGRFVLQGRSDAEVLTADGWWNSWEFKTGRASVHPAHLMLQSRGYSMMLAQEFALDEVRAHVVSAGEELGEGHTIAEYNGAEKIRTFTKEIAEICLAAIADKAPRRPGEIQCRYCLARGSATCPESQHVVESLMVTANTPVDLFRSMTPERRAELLDLCRGARAVAEQIEDMSRALLVEDDNAVPGWEIAKPVKVPVVKDIPKAFNCLAGMKFTPEMFTSACSLSIGSVVDAFHAAQSREAKAEGRKPMSKAEANRLIRATLAPVIEFAERQGRLRRKMDVLASGDKPVEIDLHHESE